MGYFKIQGGEEDGPVAVIWRRFGGHSVKLVFLPDATGKVIANSAIMKIEVAHHLSREEARQRVEELIETLKVQYKNELQDLAVAWTDYNAHVRLQARGYSTAGNLGVGERNVELDFYLPFLLQVFGKKIRAVVEAKLEESLA
jgi:hypothetical protein